MVGWRVGIIGCGVLMGWLVAGGSVGAQSSNPQPLHPSSPVWEDGLAVVGSVRVDPSNRTVLATGWVNQVEGAIELLACGPGGKTHESVFVLNVNPLDLQTGLLLLGLKPGVPPKTLGQLPPDGPRLNIWVRWEEGGAVKKERAERWVYNCETRSTLPETSWVFTGSMVEYGEFKALAEESLVATYVDPWAIVNMPLPCGTNDEILAVNTNAVAPLKTPVTLIFEDARATPAAP